MFIGLEKMPHDDECLIKHYGEALEAPKFGWMVVCDVNPKDRAGGDGPMKTYMFLFTTNGNFAYDSAAFGNINNNVQFLDLMK
ncbi:hypothetical protein [Polynucleobacter sp. MWH-HuK1]|uniref:hypothetical protein n=1 Tax=Polynucleobacter sp. MWH-HuK1 TaxID=1743158 RepID=UPI001C0E45A4|nr:hypothetical protein [Polynucleobacter sp. MWH-HuK1]